MSLHCAGKDKLGKTRYSVVRVCVEAGGGAGIDAIAMKRGGRGGGHNGFGESFFARIGAPISEGRGRR